MTNIVAFPTKTAPAKTAPAKAKKPAKPARKTTKQLAPDRIYYVSDLTAAVHVAGVLYQDMKVVKKLHAELEDRFAKGDLQRKLSPHLRALCAKYLEYDQGDSEATVAKMYHVGD